MILRKSSISFYGIVLNLEVQTKEIVVCSIKRIKTNKKNPLDNKIYLGDFDIT